MRTLSPNVRKLGIDIAVLATLALCASVLRAETHSAIPRILLGSGKSHLIDTTVNIERVSVASPEIAEAVPVNPRTLMINGKAPGETSVIIWLDNGPRQEYDLNVRLSPSRIDGATRQAEEEFGGKVHLKVDNASVY